MINLIYSYYKPICLSLVVLLGLACGHLLDSVLQLKLHPEVRVDTAMVKTSTGPARALAEADLNLVLRNNIFDADNRSASVSMNPADKIATAEGEETTAPRSDLKLIGTVVASENSLALLAVDKEMQLFRLGEELPGGGVLEEVRRTEVTVRNRDRSLSTLVLYDQGPDSPARSARQSPGANRKGFVTDKKPATNAGNGVREVGENRWVVAQNTVDAIRENFAAQLRLAQMQPRLVDGKTNGFLIQRIYPQSILARMGLQRGDVVLDVNNIRLDSPEKALQIFQQLREARRVTVSVERNGQPQSFVYEIE